MVARGSASGVATSSLRTSELATRGLLYFTSRSSSMSLPVSSQNGEESMDTSSLPDYAQNSEESMDTSSTPDSSQDREERLRRRRERERASARQRNSGIKGA